MKAPDFSLPDQHGITHTLSDTNGQWRIVYFYPKDDTPGCTTEACNFRDTIHLLTDRNIKVFGISKDTVRSHLKFAEKFKLPFPLLSDPSTGTIQAYGAWGPKKFMGREFLGTQRKTFVISPEGEIIKEYYGMDLKTHAQEILKDIEPLL